MTLSILQSNQERFIVASKKPRKKKATSNTSTLTLAPKQQMSVMDYMIENNLNLKDALEEMVAKGIVITIQKKD